MTLYKDLIGTEGLEVGEDFARPLALQTKAGAALLPASFATLYFTIRKKWAPLGALDSDADVIAQASLANGGIVADAGNVVIVTVAGLSLVVRPKLYVYDVKGTTLLGERKVLVRGNIELLPRAGLGIP